MWTIHAFVLFCCMVLICQKTQSTIDDVFRQLDEAAAEATTTQQNTGWCNYKMKGSRKTLVKIQHDMILERDMYDRVFSKSNDSKEELNVCLARSSDKEKRDDNQYRNVADYVFRSKRYAAKEDRRWPRKTIYYKIDSGFDHKERENILEAMGIWSDYTCLKFKNRTDEFNYIYIVPSFECSSGVGCMGGLQFMQLNKTSCMKIPIILHELGHAIGLYHEHSRPDREKYVTVHETNIHGNMSKEFDKIDPNEYVNFSKPYDYRSIMHYGKRYAAAHTNASTLTTTDEAYADIIGEATVLSFYDAMLVNAMYNCSGNCEGKTCPEKGFLTATCECYCESNSTNETWTLCPGEYCQPQDIDLTVYNVYNKNQDTILEGEDLYETKFRNGDVLIVKDNRFEVNRYVGNYTCKDGQWISILSEYKKDIDDCAPKPCQNGGACSDLVNRYTCKCAAGFNGHNCQTNINECALIPCKNGATCIDRINAYSCTCVAGWTGTNCDQNINECAPIPCKNGATCIDRINAYSCKCVTGWAGTNCDKNINECALNPCKNGATCIDGINAYSCKCVAGWTGTNCDQNINECAPIPCKNGATCIDGINAYSCKCVAGWTGTNCDQNINECAPIPCKNGATCIDGINAYSCKCVAGWTGTNCDQNINECAPIPCKNGATCIDRINAYSCKCVTGWAGTNCDKNINECAPIPCKNGATCIDGINAYSCKCVAEWTGTNCDQTPQSRTQTRAFKSLFEERQCQSVATLTNGVIIGDVRNNNVSYKCDHGFFSNVPNLQQILFSCKYIQELGSVAWKGQGIEVKGKQGLQALYFNAVKCSPGCPQPDYSKFPENLMVNSISSAKLIIVNSTGLPIEDPTYFLSGDTIAWTCEEGYVHTGLPGNETNQEFDNYNMYNEYETSKDEAVAPAKALTCGDDGYWNSGNDEDLGFCKEITCDARDYQNIRNGVIANYKHVYEFNETMTLDCDHGFRPYKNHEYLHCLDEESFEDEYFGCEAITCPRPPEPLHGGLERTQLYYYPNQTAEFYCDPGYVMKGARTWQCLASGIWDKPCVRCARADNHCQPPCIPFGAHVINPPRRIDIGTTMVFACDEKMNGRPTYRTCLLSKQWSGEQIYCTGRSLFMSDMNDVISIATVIKRTQDSANTAANAYDDSYVISIAFETGVDVYFLMDVSKSIDERQFEQMKKCINGVVENLGLNNTQDSTRVGVYLFATNVKATFTPRDRLSASEMIAALDKTSLRDSRVDTGLRTAISKALDYMRAEIHAKRLTSGIRISRDVIILLSDGKYTQGGSPVMMAELLKTQFEVLFFSIAFGSNDDKAGLRVMEQMASKVEGEQFYFAMESKNGKTADG